MHDRELRESLQRLPEARPGAEFTAEVMARVAAWEERRPSVAGEIWRPALLAAALALLVAAGGLWWAAESSLPGKSGGGKEASAALPVGPSADVGTAGPSPPSGDRTRDRTARAATSGDPGQTSPAARDLAGPGDVAPREPVGPVTTNASGESTGTPSGSDFFAPPPARGATEAGGDAFEALSAAERLARLRVERAALEGRVAVFRRELPPAEPPLVLLGTADGLELVFDLAQWSADLSGAEAPRGVRPAVRSTAEPPRRH